MSENRCAICSQHELVNKLELQLAEKDKDIEKLKSANYRLANTTSFGEPDDKKRIGELVKELDEAVELLKFYGFQENYHYDSNNRINYIYDDFGKREREFLAKVKRG
jgi:hypothetical protein